MNKTMSERAVRAAGRIVVGLAVAMPLASRAAAPSAFSSVTATAQTNYNGSVVTAAYSSGSFDGYTVALKVGDTSYAGIVGDGVVTFAVPGSAVVASNIYTGTITATETASSKTTEIAFKYLFQGANVPGAPSVWFTESAAQVQKEGSWAPKTPDVSDNKYVFNDDADEWKDGWFSFRPSARSTGHFVSLETDVSFEAALDMPLDNDASAQASIHLVTVAEDAYRFVVLDGGVWKTNDTFVAALNTDYKVRVDFNYRVTPATVTYSVQTGSVVNTLWTDAVAGGNKLAIESLAFNGCGKLAQMSGSNVTDTVDASLVKDTDNVRYANINEATAAGKTELTLLWNTAWTPDAKADKTWTIHGDGKSLYVNDVPGVCVTKADDTYTVIANYWESMFLLAAGDPLKVMYFTNALEIAKDNEAYTNLYLLRDVVLPAGVKVYRDTWFNGESNILSGAGLAVQDCTFTIVGGCIGIAPPASGVVLAGGRFNEATTNSWKDFLPQGYKFAEMAIPVRPGYWWQFMESAKAPGDGQELLPVTDSNGESVSIVLNKDWAEEVTGTKDAATQSRMFSEVQANELTRLDNEILGLANQAGNIPVITPVQSAEPATVTFSLGNVDIAADSGATVKYRVVTSSNPGGKDGSASAYVDTADSVPMPLPTSQEGVKYYIIEVDIGAVK